MSRGRAKTPRLLRGHLVLIKELRLKRGAFFFHSVGFQLPPHINTVNRTGEKHETVNRAGEKHEITWHPLVQPNTSPIPRFIYNSQFSDSRRNPLSAFPSDPRWVLPAPFALPARGDCPGFAVPLRGSQPFQPRYLQRRAESGGGRCEIALPAPGAAFPQSGPELPASSEPPAVPRGLGWTLSRCWWHRWWHRRRHRLAGAELGVRLVGADELRFDLAEPGEGDAERGARECPRAALRGCFCPRPGHLSMAPRFPFASRSLRAAPRSLFVFFRLREGERGVRGESRGLKASQRMLWMFRDDLIPSRTPFQRPRLLRAPSNLALGACRGSGAATAALASPSTLTAKSFSLISDPNLFQLKASPPCPPVTTCLCEMSQESFVLFPEVISEHALPWILAPNKVTGRGNTLNEEKKKKMK